MNAAFALDSLSHNCKTGIRQRNQPMSEELKSGLSVSELLPDF